MQRGNNPRMVLAANGALMCIATGSDATTEHEGGSQELMNALAGAPGPEKAALAQRLRSEGAIVYPDLMASKRITRDLDRVEYAERDVGGELQAVVLYHAQRSFAGFGNTYVDAQLRLGTTGEAADLAGAWDATGFAFKVRGNEKVAQLREFAKALKAGKAMFAGTFMADSLGRLSGVIIAIEELLTPAHLAAMKGAQVKFEADVRLLARARTQELNELMRAIPHRSIGYIWPAWEDSQVDGDVVYRLNPGYLVDAEYGGPYGFDQLHAWLKAGASTPLRVNRETAAVA